VFECYVAAVEKVTGCTLSNLRYEQQDVKDTVLPPAPAVAVAEVGISTVIGQQGVAEAVGSDATDNNETGSHDSSITSGRALVAASFSVSSGQQRVVEFRSNPDSTAQNVATESYSYQYTGRKDGGELPEPKRSPYLDLATALKVCTICFCSRDAQRCLFYTQEAKADSDAHLSELMASENTQPENTQSENTQSPSPMPTRDPAAATSLPSSGAFVLCVHGCNDLTRTVLANACATLHTAPNACATRATGYAVVPCCAKDGM
jgi:hypothetical protein